MKEMKEFLRTFWTDIVTVMLAIFGVVLGVVIWFKLYRLNKVFTRLPKLSTGIACGLIGGLIGFLLGILLEDSIEV